MSRTYQLHEKLYLYDKKFIVVCLYRPDFSGNPKENKSKSHDHVDFNSCVILTLQDLSAQFFQKLRAIPILEEVNIGLKFKRYYHSIYFYELSLGCNDL